MTKELKSDISSDDDLGCFGDFYREDLICKKYCALRLRCIIERDQNARLEILEEWVSCDHTTMKIQ